MRLFDRILSKREEPIRETSIIKSHDELVDEAYELLLQGDPLWMTKICGGQPFDSGMRILEACIAKYVKEH